MKEQLINFITAKLAKEKGFNETVKEYETDIAELNPDKFLFPKNSDLPKHYVSMFTQSLLQKWLRDMHNIIVNVEAIPDQRDNSVAFYFSILQNNDWLPEEYDDTIPIEEPYFKTYEKALEEGLFAALNLIKI